MLSGCVGWFKCLLDYNTVRYLTVKKWEIGLLNLSIQGIIFSYILGYEILSEKGYQAFSDIESEVTTKVKGVVYTNFSDDEYKKGVDSRLYNRVWDETDYVVPPSDSAFFVATNVVITPNQTRGACPEDATISGDLCDPANNTCEKGKTLDMGHGPMTGDCKDNDEGNFTCEIMGWCPLEKDVGPLRNVLENSDETYLGSCRYHPETDRHCPIFVIDYLISASGENFSAVAVRGGIFAINIHWECNLDFSLDYCVPTYSFKRLDKQHALFAKGIHFRHANYYMNDNRTLYKLYGIDFVVLVTGRGGMFHFATLVITIGSTIALFGAATVISDFALWLCVGRKELDKVQKYVEVELECTLCERMKTCCSCCCKKSDDPNGSINPDGNENDQISLLNPQC